MVDVQVNPQPWLLAGTICQISLKLAYQQTQRFCLERKLWASTFLVSADPAEVAVAEVIDFLPFSASYLPFIGGKATPKAAVFWISCIKKNFS